MHEIIVVDNVRVSIGNHSEKRIVIGADHRGFKYKVGIVHFLQNNLHEVLDVGTDSDERCDYPAIADKIGKLISDDKDHNTIGIGICGSGIGMSIPAGKHKGVYIVRCLNKDEAVTARKHNNANMLCLAADSISFQEAIETVMAFLNTPFFSDQKTEIHYLRRFVQTVKLENNI